MAISIAVSSQTTTNKKAMWAWVISEKHSKFGSTVTESSLVGDFIAMYSALTTISSDYDVVFRTRHKNVADIINDSSKITKNPVIFKIRQMIAERNGKVMAVVVNPVSLVESDKRCYKMTLVLANKYQQKNPAVREAVPVKKNSTVRMSVTKRKQSREVLYTGLEDYDEEVKGVIDNSEKLKPVLCHSCDMPISPLTQECGCSN